MVRISDPETPLHLPLFCFSFTGLKCEPLSIKYHNMYVCTYLCMYVPMCMKARVCVCVFMCLLRMYVFECVNACMYVFAYVYVCACLCVYAWIYVYMCVYVCAFVYMCYVYLCLCAYLCLHVCMVFVCVCILCVCLHRYVFMNISVYLCVHVHVCSCVCVHTCVWIGGGILWLEGERQPAHMVNLKAEERCEFPHWDSIQGWKWPKRCQNLSHSHVWTAAQVVSPAWSKGSDAVLPSLLPLLPPLHLPPFPHCSLYPRPLSHQVLTG